MNMPPGWDGIETIEHLWRADPALQIVVCTAADLSWDQLRSRLGPSDNLLILKKPFDPIEVRQLAYTMTRKWFVTQQAEHHLELLDKMVSDRTRDLEETNAELRRSEERFAKAFLSSPIPLAIQAVNDDRFVDVNDAFALLTGFERVELVGRTPLEVRICIDYDPGVVKELNAGKLVRNAEAQVSTRDGEIRNVVVSLERISLSDEPHLLVMLQEAPRPEANASAIFEIDLNSIAALDLGPTASGSGAEPPFSEVADESEPDKPRVHRPHRGRRLCSTQHHKGRAAQQWLRRDRGSQCGCRSAALARAPRGDRSTAHRHGDAGKRKWPRTR
jgi:PAS domain S-box-containing protein